eukprot:CAMPEP_0174349952 /NCGR_PEP_ID=MMETSP0811_2-20130205/6862_1 /TAXON_ID=73025 ORGANISM="Eutreptiella gymnastica-like, Strain CCMP1594" /NCGR_SAMPLE_ID=MMETSP0811_2 /ASSEMBLY_ACC=CAM_ASM_000667 /LENGTH=105 /DNA_ID=CAMNT_0015477783 /DNA_START=659 /DNA_END=975 /DNA_ORIENTATION=+
MGLPLAALRTGVGPVVVFATGVTAVDRVAKLAQTARLHVPFSSAARDQGFWQKASKSKHSWDGENQDLALVTAFDQTLANAALTLHRVGEDIDPGDRVWAQQAEW